MTFFADWVLTNKAYFLGGGPVANSAQNIQVKGITAPGCGKKRETIDAYVQQSNSTAIRQTAVVNEYLMQVSDETNVLSATQTSCLKWPY